MGYDLTGRLVVGVSASALFDLEESDRATRSEGEADSRAFPEERLDDPLAPGVASGLVRRLLALNDLAPSADDPLVEVVVLSRRSPETGLRVMRSARHHGLAITRAVFRQGRAPHELVAPLHVDLFLSADEVSVRETVDRGLPAGRVLDPASADERGGELRIVFDVDQVIGDGAGTDPLPDGGPLRGLLAGVRRLQEAQRRRRDTDAADAPRLHVALVTGRPAPEHERAVTTLRSWGVALDDAYFLAGVDPSDVLAVLRPHVLVGDLRAVGQGDRAAMPFPHMPPAHMPAAHVPVRVAERRPGPEARSRRRPPRAPRPRPHPHPPGRAGGAPSRPAGDDHPSRDDDGARRPGRRRPPPPDPRAPGPGARARADGPGARRRARRGRLAPWPTRRPRRRGRPRGPARAEAAARPPVRDPGAPPLTVTVPVVEAAGARPAPRTRPGRVEVVCGPMFAGKTEELLRRVRRAQVAGRRVLVVGHVLDTRRGADVVSSHSGLSVPSRSVSGPDELEEVVGRDGPWDLVAVDEAHFFGPRLVDAVQRLADAGAVVVVAGLDVTFDARPFEPLPSLAALAERVAKLTAVCAVCGEDAAFHLRTTADPPGAGDALVAAASHVGGAEAYEARCRAHLAVAPWRGSGGAAPAGGRTRDGRAGDRAGQAGGSSTSGTKE
ncbi:thymidine kinase [Cellulosimicrobium sp. CUA-896]|uniref:thymidine kinase n=1 Tax=Cellulosimicrobium sp. CUA-896 TaxID=1517881 RepID=UPI000969C7EB|nr:hypothetical protein BJF88_00085 [Cellulosimicrobium sp. CUA-896]